MPDLLELNRDLATAWSGSWSPAELPDRWGWEDAEQRQQFQDVIREFSETLAVDDTPGARRLMEEVDYCEGLSLYRAGRCMAEFLLRHVDRSQTTLGRRIQPPKPNKGRLRRGWNQGQVSAYLRYLTNRSAEPSANMDPHSVVHVSLQLLELGREVFTGAFEHRWVLPPHLRTFEKSLVATFEEIANRVDPHQVDSAGACLPTLELAVQQVLVLDPRYRSPLAVSLVFAHIGLVNRYRPMDDTDGQVKSKLVALLDALVSSATEVQDSYKRPLADASLANFACMARLHLVPAGGDSAERDREFEAMVQSGRVEHDFAEDCLLLNALAMFDYFAEHGAVRINDYADWLLSAMESRSPEFSRAAQEHDMTDRASSILADRYRQRTGRRGNELKRFG